MKSKDEKYLESIIDKAEDAVPEEVAREIAEEFEETEEKTDKRGGVANTISAWYAASKVNPTEMEDYARCVFVLALLKLERYSSPISLKGVRPNIAEALREFNRKYKVVVTKESERVEGDLYLIGEDKGANYTLGSFEYTSKYIDVFKAVKPCNYESMKITAARNLSKGASTKVYHVKVNDR